MNLEDRMAMLEGEMKILKNEIQGALLTIQEQVLIHYYPALRAEDSSSSESIVQSLESLPEEGRGATGDTLIPPGAQPPSRYREAVALPSFTALAEWMSDSIERIGTGRTREALETFASGGYLAPEVKDMLLQLISLSDEENPLEKVEINEILDVFLGLNRVLGHGGNLDVILPSIEEESIG